MRAIQKSQVKLGFFALSVCLIACNEIAPPQKRLPTGREDIVMSFASVVKKVAPAIVNVYGTRHLSSSDPAGALLTQLFGLGDPASSVDHAIGSGVLVSKDGFILTSSHVVEGADSIEVTLADKRRFTAILRALDPQTGLALLRIEGVEDLPFLPVHSEGHLEVGDLVLAMGNPFGVGQTVTSGIISALGHQEAGITDLRTFIQTDAAVNPGNSGGPLLTTDGRLVGINTAIYSKTGSFAGIGFATPSALALPLLNSPKTGGRVVRPDFGFDTKPVPANLVHVLGLSHPYGVLVGQVVPEGPAGKAGIHSGDFIVEVNGRLLEDQARLHYILAATPMGTTIALTLLRQGKKMVVLVPLPVKKT